MAGQDFVLDALEQAVHDRPPGTRMGLVHDSDRGPQCLSIRYSERLAEAGIQPAVGSVGDSYDNALAETIDGLFKAEVIHCRILEPTGNIRPPKPGPTSTWLWKLRPWTRNSR